MRKDPLWDWDAPGRHIPCATDSGYVVWPKNESYFEGLCRLVCCTPTLKTPNTLPTSSPYLTTALPERKAVGYMITGSSRVVEGAPRTYFPGCWCLSYSMPHQFPLAPAIGLLHCRNWFHIIRCCKLFRASGWPCLHVVRHLYAQCSNEVTQPNRYICSTTMLLTLKNNGR